MADEQVTLAVQTVLSTVKWVAGGIAAVVAGVGGALWRLLLRQQRDATKQIALAHQAEVALLKDALATERALALRADGKLSEANAVIKRCAERDALEGTADALKEQLAELRADLNAATKDRLGDLRTSAQVTEGVLNSVLEGVRSVNGNLVALQMSLRAVSDEIRDLTADRHSNEVILQKIDILAERFSLLATSCGAKKGGV